jgi:hypothetical protein
MGKRKNRLGLVVMSGLLLLGGGSAGAIAWGLRGVADEIQTAPGFAAGWGRAITNPALLEAIGTPTLAPFDLVKFVAGRQPWLFTQTYSDKIITTETAVRTIREEHDLIEVPIQGPKGTGALSMEVVQVSGMWQLKKLEARLTGQPASLNLLASGAAAQSK